MRGLVGIAFFPPFRLYGAYRVRFRASQTLTVELGEGVTDRRARQYLVEKDVQIASPSLRWRQA